MTTPAINTPNGVICDAYQDAGWIGEQQTPTSEQYAKGMRRLRDLINAWQTQGLKLWVNVDTTIPLVGGTATYTLGSGGLVNMTKPLRVLEGYYLTTANEVRRPLSPMSWRDYLTLGQAGTLAANRGVISQYFADKQATLLSVTFWQCPDATEAANGAAHLLLQTQITNPISLTETMSFPDEWRLALRWGLADELATGQPQTIMDRCAQKAELYRRALEDWDVEDAPTKFAPDTQMQQGNRSFT